MNAHALPGRFSALDYKARSIYYTGRGREGGQIMRRIGGTASSIVRRGVAAILFTVVGMLLAGGPGQAAGRPAVGATVSRQAGLIGVSCSSADTCMAVGTLLEGPTRDRGLPPC